MAKRGRPALPENQKRNQHIMLRLTKAQKALLDQAAADAELVPSLFVRSLVLAVI